MVASSKDCRCCGKAGHIKANCPSKVRGAAPPIRSAAAPRPPLPSFAFARGARILLLDTRDPRPAAWSPWLSTRYCCCCFGGPHAPLLTLAPTLFLCGGVPVVLQDKTCGSCGMVGHLRATCRSTANVKAGAFASGGGAKDCRCCGKVGHIKAECPSKDKTCGSCGMVGHLRATCRKSDGGGGGGRTGGAKKTIRKSGGGAKDCRCCGKVGHIKADCPMKDKECSVCGMAGHLKATCRAAGGDAAKGAKKAAPGKKPKEVAPTMEGLDADMDDYFKDEEKVAAAPEAAEAAATEAPMEEAAAAEASAE
jgi:cellular nucleic acid-binding protein